jgi:deoxyribodipyrimidine photo-lyase
MRIENIGFTPLHVRYTMLKEKLDALALKIHDYTENRDYLFRDATSNLSVELRFGTLSIREVLRYLILLKQEGKHTEPFFRQLIFREFYAYLLYHFPLLATHNYRYKTPNSHNSAFYDAFCTAQTGYPLIDAAITQLLQTGEMHNRARMIVGSFFTKHLCLPWQQGEAFFAKHLLDYDAASNILSWQWCAGTGIDPQPYFRIFNPYSQSKKFDANAVYIKRWLPNLKKFTPKELCHEDFLIEIKIENYPKPIIRHDVARQIFLDFFKQINK